MKRHRRSPPPPSDGGPLSGDRSVAPVSDLRCGLLRAELGGDAAQRFIDPTLPPFAGLSEGGKDIAIKAQADQCLRLAMGGMSVITD
jgi:hypothetical protein